MPLPDDTPARIAELEAWCRALELRLATLQDAHDRLVKIVQDHSTAIYRITTKIQGTNGAD